MRRTLEVGVIATLIVEHAPGDTGEFVGQGNRQHIAMQPRRSSRKPAAEHMPWPTLRRQQDSAGALHKQGAQVSVAAAADAAEDRSVTRRDLFRHKAEPSTEIAALGKG